MLGIISQSEMLGAASPTSNVQGNLQSTNSLTGPLLGFEFGPKKVLPKNTPGPEKCSCG